MRLIGGDDAILGNTLILTMQAYFLKLSFFEMSLLLHLQAVKYYVLYYEHTDSDLRRQSDFLQKASKPVSVS